MKRASYWCGRILKQDDVRSVVVLQQNHREKHALAVSLEKIPHLERGEYLTKRLPEILRRIAERLENLKEIRWPPAPSKVRTKENRK